jgi:hypothetical protein
MNLRDGVVGVRNKLGEGAAWLFDTNDIIRDLNTSARGMCSEAQALRETYAGITTYNPVLKVWNQEYAMPDDCEFPYDGKIKLGGLWPLIFKPQAQLQTGAYVSSIPIAAYLRRGIQKTQQVPDSQGQEAVVPTVPPTGRAYWWVGFWPVPSQAVNFWIEYVALHPQMTDPMSPCLIPEASYNGVDFRQAWEAYAVARGKEKEGDLLSAQYYDEIHAKGKLAFKDYLSVTQAQAVPPMYGGDGGLDSPLVAIMAPSAANLTIEGS